MPVQITQENFSQLNEAANQVTQIIFEHTKSERGVHVETAISAPCFLAGTLILRSTGVDLSKLTPGQPVFVNVAHEGSEDVVNDAGRDVHSFMKKICSPLGLEPFGGWNQPVPDNHQPLQSGIDLVQKIEQPFLDLMDRLGVPGEFHPYAAAFAGMKVIQMGKQALNPDIGKAIALSSLVAGCKTVPYS
jgi:hypothetical protein